MDFFDLDIKLINKFTRIEFSEILKMLRSDEIHENYDKDFFITPNHELTFINTIDFN